MWTVEIRELRGCVVVFGVRQGECYGDGLCVPEQRCSPLAVGGQCMHAF